MNMTSNTTEADNSPRSASVLRRHTKPRRRTGFGAGISAGVPGPARGTWWYLYLIMDVFSRKIVGHEVYETETGQLAADLIQKACWREQLTDRHKPLILHSDNGSPMKAATVLEKSYDLGITPSYSRPRVSNDNAFAESAFKTLKYRPGFPIDGFATLAMRRQLLWPLGDN